MTTITYTGGEKSVFLHLLAALGSAAAALAHAWKQQREARALEALPFETMKDIGYRAGSAEEAGNTKQ